MDVERRTFNIDINHLEDVLKKHSRSHTSPRVWWLRRHGSAVIEDAAQAIAAEYKQRHAGSLGSIGCCSFSQQKPRGIRRWRLLTTNDSELAETIGGTTRPRQR